MKTVFYKIECLTNLHVGSGEINYSVVDNEVEKDAVSGLPIIHASGVKGAIKEALVVSGKYKPETIKSIFGAEGNSDVGFSGSHKFLDATLISRPMRVFGKCGVSSVSVATVDSINRCWRKMNAFDAMPADVRAIGIPDFSGNTFLAAAEGIQIEGDPTGELTGEVLENLKKWEGIAFTFPFAIAQSFEDYDLPVVARNCLVDGHENLWYEEVVPHGSILYFAVIYPDGAAELVFPDVVQFGGNASIGCGYTKISKISESAGSEGNE